MRVAAALLLTGAATLLAQVVLLRELLSASFGVELLVVLGLGALLLGGALGSLAARGAGAGGSERTAWLFLGLAWATLHAGLFLRGERVLFGAVPGAYLPLGLQLLGICIAFLPAGCIGGALFRHLATEAAGRGRGVGWAYGLECAGGVIGGGLATALSGMGVSNVRTACVLSLLLALGALLLSRGRRVLGLVALFTLALAGASAVSATRLDLLTLRWGHRQVAEVRDTPYGRLTISRDEGQVVVYRDGALLFESQGTSAEEFVHPSALQVERPRRILVLGGSCEGLLWEALKHEPECIVAVEMDRAFFDSVVRHLPAEARVPFEDPRVEVTTADPRGYLKRYGGWDLILVGAGEPTSGASNRLYTTEFFRLASARLNPGGVLALRLRSSENIWTPLLARRNASIHRALADAFPHTGALPGANLLLLASRSPLVVDPDELAARWRDRGVQARLVCEPYLRYILTNERAGAIRKMLHDVRAPANRDGRPVCYAFTAELWLSRFWPGAGFGGGEESAGWAGGAGIAGVSFAVLAAGLVPLLLRKRPLAARVLLAFAAGFAGMVFESALLLAYQSGVGALYRDLGLLISLFMAGLALGSMSVERAARRFPRAADLWAITFSVALVGCAGALLVTGAAGSWTVGLLLLGGGASTGSLFALAAAGTEGQKRIGVLYACDLAGAFAGATVGGLILLPFAGLVASLLVAMSAIWVGGGGFLLSARTSFQRQ